MIGAIAVILVFGGLIFFHELGHFLIARAFGMGVKTFSLGFGPSLFSLVRGKTRYQVAALPLGGFVSLVGESPGAGIPEGFTEEESFALRPAWQRFLVILAGPVFNLALAWFICWGLLYANGKFVTPPVVNEIVADSAAADSPLSPGDRIRSIDGIEIHEWVDISPLVQRSQGKAMTVVLERPDQSTVVFSITPTFLRQQLPDGQSVESWAMGIRPVPGEKERLGFFAAAGAGLDEAGHMATAIWRAVGDLVSRQVSFDNVGGPVLIAQQIYTHANHGLYSVLMLAAFISVNLGMLNLLPIPVLDGGHLLFLTAEMLAGRPVPEGLQEKAMFVGLFLLLGLFTAATFNDVMRFW